MDEVDTTCWFSGRVQGVGFRWITREVLEGHAIDGYVRNLTDGRVELRLQGSRDDVEAAINAVRMRLAENIEAVEREERPIQDRLGAFRIARG